MTIQYLVTGRQGFTPKLPPILTTKEYKSLVEKYKHEETDTHPMEEFKDVGPRFSTEIEEE